MQNWLVLRAEDPAARPAARPVPRPVPWPVPWSGLSRQPHPALDVRTRGVAPGTALALCRHYLAHPEDRAELRGEAGVQRARAVADASR